MGQREDRKPEAAAHELGEEARQARLYLHLRQDRVRQRRQGEPPESLQNRRCRSKCGSMTDRNEILEECAKVCEAVERRIEKSKKVTRRMQHHIGALLGASMCADKIRKLKRRTK